MSTLRQEVEILHRQAMSLSNYISYSHLFKTLNVAEQERLKVQNDILWMYVEALQARLNAYKDGESCGHPGCLNHFTHPCEHCGRINGIAYSMTNRVSFTYLGCKGPSLEFKCSFCDTTFSHIGPVKLTCPNCGGE